MEIQDLYALYTQSYLVDTDTRKIRRGSIFFALKGDNFNGNKFVNAALEKGARYCVIDQEQYALEGKTILVEDVLSTLQKLANYHRNQLNIPIVSLTGSNGKTTTKELIHSVLKTQYKAHANLGNLNNHIGVPLTLLSFDNTTEIGIVEMGANHQKEIEFLSSIAEPDYGYITNFGKAHLEGFGGIEGVIKGKSELYTFLSENDKTVFVNQQDEKQLELTQDIQRILFEENIKLTSTHPYLELSYSNLNIKTHLTGSYNFPNIIAAITIGQYFNISQENIKKSIENYIPENNRSQIIQKEENTILLDAYNANPSSVSLALENFHLLEHSNKVVILGDMFELGASAKEEHQSMVDLTNKLAFNRSIFVGKNYYVTNAEEKFETFESLKSHLTQHPITGAYFLIKGSRGMALERLLTLIS